MTFSQQCSGNKTLTFASKGMITCLTGILIRAHIRLEQQKPTCLVDQEFEKNDRKRFFIQQSTLFKSSIFSYEFEK